ncbi:MAG: histidine phosphatase family protein [Actinomycetota bacterium]|nr:histidine phosphatase family protein [Actinomycetota bacterium]
MAQQLWLLRHGEAEPHDSRTDFDRELTDRGRNQATAAGRALAALALEFHLVFTSPKVRARDTARLACAELGVEPLEHDALASGFDAREALALVAAAGPEQRVLVVGHEPEFSTVVGDLTGGRVDLKKGGIAGVRIDGAAGELIVVLRPREINRIAPAP